MSVVGGFSQDIDFGGSSCSPALGKIGSNADIFVADLSLDTSCNWAQALNVEGANLPPDAKPGIHRDGSDNTYLAGSFHDDMVMGQNGPTAHGHGSSFDGFLLKLDTDGDHDWHAAFGGVGNNFATEVAEDASGGAIWVSGRYSSDPLVVREGDTEVDTVPAPTGTGDDLFLSKFTTTGEHQLTKGFALDGPGQILGLAVDSNGNVVLSGQFTGTVNFGGPDLVSGTVANVFVAKLDPRGCHLWSYSFGSDSFQASLDVAIASSDQVVLTGSYAGAFDLGGSLLPSIASGTEMFLARLWSSPQ